ncbi:MAG TPA: glycosyl hydrolase-related protein [Phycisphaerae bacterium]|jgi:alpha-mannosidase|nr:hypothetical protein [Phycisphaerae bacterium]HOB73009.1 glycosyl hydrolase-related protein [Phycisphaerae bacterium]HPU31398.1 glycosyl hydrolase-related protein [Phycisphaerae bacterium]HQA44878.1 glycosyl hydrolase-related protein [Phycisphaerae bacterium]HQE41673.1 glycosyl hydrolase-related protein [Phycisphaerae bacterium]
MPIADTFRLVWTPFLRKQAGRWMQAVGLSCPTVLGSGGELTLMAGSRKLSARPVDLLRYPYPDCGQEGSATYLWLIPRPERPLRCRAVWKTPLGATFRSELTLKPANPVRAHVIFKTHLDLGYTHRLNEVVRLYQTTYMERLLDNLDATAARPPGRRFVWTLSTWLAEKCLDPKAVKPSLLERFERHIREGNVVWGLMPFTTHSEFFGFEEMCRSLYAARRLAERYGVPVPRAARMTDVPAHTASLGMAFAAAGGTFFQINTNPESRPPAVPPLFWWKFPNGARLLVHYHESYGTPLLPPESWPYAEWPAVRITGDNEGPPGLETIEQIDWIEKHFDAPVCHTGRLEDFADAFVHQHGKELPTVDKELTDWWIYGIASQARTTALARRAKDRLISAETLAALAAWASEKSVSEANRREVRAGLENLALYTEHTWGDHASDARRALPRGNLYTARAFAGQNPRPPADRWVASWQDKAHFAQTAHECAGRAESAALAAYGEHLAAGQSAAGNRRTDTGRNGDDRPLAPWPALAGSNAARTKSAATCIAVFNTLSWPRGGIVHLADVALPRGEFELVDSTTGGLVPYERTADGIVAIVPTVPACGYLILEPRPVVQRSRPGRPADWEDRNLALHTAEYTLQFHASGGLARWHDRRHSIQWCSGTAEYPTGAYLYEMPGGERLKSFARQVHTNAAHYTEGLFHRRDYDRVRQFGPLPGGPARVHPEITPLYARVVLQAPIPPRRPRGRRAGDARRYQLTYTLYHNRPELHVNLRLFAKTPTYAAEAGYAFFPFAINQPHILVDRIAHLTTPAVDLVRGVNAAHMAVHHGVRVEDDHVGMNFYPLDTPLVSFAAPGAYLYKERGDDVSATLYATLFNNCWGTNFAQWQGGDFSFNFVLHPTGNDGWDGGLAKGGMEYFRPLLATVLPCRPAVPAGSLLQIESPAVQLVTLKPADFQPGYVLRLWNSLLDPTEARITLPAARRGDQLWRCDLLERTARRVPMSSEGRVRLKLGPHEIATLLLSPA